MTRSRAIARASDYFDSGDFLADLARRVAFRTDLSVGRLDQDYVRSADEGRHLRYDYAAPVFDFACRLVYDESGLVLDYPGIAVRAF